MSDINISTPKELGNLINGKSDAEINSTVEGMGAESALEKVFDGMTKAFLADKAKGQTAVIQWDIKTPSSAFTYQVNVADGKCTFTKGSPDKARVTLSAALPDFLRVITGQIAGQQAFFSGKLKLAGDMMFAMTQENWFDKQKG
ncbi:MAG TPA: SCP2 sterol-binding domain-containing protein [Polyangiaceae bacterium]|jgi:putative sterol carrier protein|nr:SCP2 sterol-binding domain-containing protein [Polyangiaceae bacterium]